MTYIELLNHIDREEEKRMETRFARSMGLTPEQLHIYQAKYKLKQENSMNDEIDDAANDAMDTKGKRVKSTKSTKKPKVKAKKKAKVVKAVVKAVLKTATVKAKAAKKAPKAKVKSVKKLAKKIVKVAKAAVSGSSKKSPKRGKPRTINDAVDKKLAKAAKEVGGIVALARLAGYSQSAITRVMYGDFKASHKLACALEDATKGEKGAVSYKHLRGVKRPKD